MKKGGSADGQPTDKVVKAWLYLYYFLRRLAFKRLLFGQLGPHLKEIKHRHEFWKDVRKSADKEYDKDEFILVSDEDHDDKHDKHDKDDKDDKHDDMDDYERLEKYFRVKLNWLFLGSLLLRRVEHFEFKQRLWAHLGIYLKTFKQRLRSQSTSLEDSVSVSRAAH